MNSNIHGLTSAITLGHNICLNILHFIIKHNIVFGNKNKIWKINIFWYTFGIHKIMKSNIFFRPEEAMLETGKSLSTKSKLVLF